MARPRTWTDDELRSAVVGATTWGQVTARLGLNPRGRNTIRLRRHAARLSLDTRHLPASVPVTPVDSSQRGGMPSIDGSAFRAAIDGAASMAEVARRLGLKLSGTTYRRLHILAEYERIDLHDLPGQSWYGQPVEVLSTPFKRPVDPHKLHQVGQAVATAWFMARGYMVSVPTEPAAYDLVVDSDVGFQKVQVKTSRSGKTVNLTRTEYGLGQSASSGKYGHRAYHCGEVDHFFIYTGLGTMYLIPLEAVQGSQGIALGRYKGYLVK